MSSLPPDPYRVLGVSKDAQIAEIRSAHRKLVLKCHPDKVQDPTLKAEKQDEFQKVQQAYELLSDENERQRYDDKAKLAELRRQVQNQKANSSAPRSSPRRTAEYEIRTAEPRASTFRTTASPSPSRGAKGYAYSRSWEEEFGPRPRFFEAEIPSRRQASYTERPSKREAERERERERASDRDKDRERERRRKADDIRRAEKEDKEARRAAKKKMEKQRDKEIRREAEEKRKYTKPYFEPYEEEILPTPTPPKMSRSKTTAGRDKRDRSAQRGEPVDPSVPLQPEERGSTAAAMHYATSYINASRVNSAPGLHRSATHHDWSSTPAAPTPPPASGQHSAYATPEDEGVRRSSARARRGTESSPRPVRESSRRKTSREPMDEPVIVDAEPQGRSGYYESASATPPMGSSPPRREVPRTRTMPTEAHYRSATGPSRSQTFGEFGESGMPRGRGRNRMQPQIEEESDSGLDYDRRPRERRHRGARVEESPEPYAQPVNITSYKYQGSNFKGHGYTSYVRHIDPEGRYYPPQTRADPRPQMGSRQGSYSSSPSSHPKYKVRTNKSYSYDDVNFSQYQQPPYREVPGVG